MAHLVTGAIDVPTLMAQVASPELGGTAVFVGTVRNHHRGRSVVALSYTAYPQMAEAESARIIRQAETDWPVRIVFQHRIGDLLPGDIAVAVAAAAAHRDAAFEACRWVIEAVKRSVPVWKQEQYADGSTAWVDPTAGNS
jgi:molybdopterin synthase catalytic subunit